MIPERDYVLAKGEVERRRRQAADERAAREARRLARTRLRTQATPAERPRGAFAWLRRLAGARH